MKYFYLQNLATPPREIEPQLPTWSPVDTAEGFGLLPCIISPFSNRYFLGLPPTFSFPRRRVRKGLLHKCFIEGVLLGET